jgi:hypothetical protein
MKRVLTLGLALSITASQAFSYSAETLKEVESASASANTAAVIIAAIIPNTKNTSQSLEALKFIGDISSQVNALTSSALQDESSILRINRIIGNLTKKVNWQDADVTNGTFAKKFAFELSHAISAEVMSFYAHKGIGIGMNALTENRIANRAAHVLGEAISSAILEATFAKIGNYLETIQDGEVPNFSTVFFTSLITGAAYNIAGEMIMQGTSDAHVNYTQAVKEAFSSKK